MTQIIPQKAWIFHRILTSSLFKWDKITWIFLLLLSCPLIIYLNISFGIQMQRSSQVYFLSVNTTANNISWKIQPLPSKQTLPRARQWLDWKSVFPDFEKRRLSLLVGRGASVFGILGSVLCPIPTYLDGIQPPPWANPGHFLAQKHDRFPVQGLGHCPAQTRGAWSNSQPVLLLESSAALWVEAQQWPQETFLLSSLFHCSVPQLQGRRLSWFGAVATIAVVRMDLVLEAA